MNSIIIDDVKKTLKSNPWKFILTAFLLWWLFFIFNILFGLTISADKIENTAASKVWIYFYIQDDESTQNEITNRILNISNALKDEWLEVQYTPKDSAFEYLENKIPELTNNFEKFGIENPLPSTLYVMFSNKREYEAMKTIIIANKDIVMNAKEVDKSATLLQQENRSLRILDTLDMIKWTLIIMSIVIVIAIITLTQHLLTNFFYWFYKDIELKKLLWADPWTANQWFMLVLWIIIAAAVIFWVILSFIVFCILDWHLKALDLNLTLKFTALLAIIPWIIFWLISVWLWYYHLNNLEKQI